MRALRKLAAAHGVLTSYYGVDGLCRAETEALLAVLNILGVPVEREDDAEDALRAHRALRESRLVDSTVVLWEGEERALPVRASANDDSVVDLLVLSEDGRSFESRHSLAALPASKRPRARVVHRLPLPDLPLGYHRIRVKRGNQEAEETESHLLVAPRTGYRSTEAAEGKTPWGLFSPVYALRSKQGFGAGELGDLQRFVGLAAAHGAGVVATLPLFATFVDEPSPYSPVSRRYWNELYTSLDDLPEWRPELMDGAGVERLEALRRDPFVDYRALAREKRPVMETLARDLRRHRPWLLEALVRRRPEVLDYARFRATCEAQRSPWTEWRERDVATGGLDDDRVLYHVFGQWLAEQQLEDASRRAKASDVALYFDWPLGVHGFGFDTWRSPSLFAWEADVGAPPDPVFRDGQSWGFPPILPEQSRSDAHHYVRASLEQAMRYADLLRVDHVMGLHRQFWIPRGFEKRDGVYVRYPAEELYAVLTLESHRHRCELVGENLGIVPRAVQRCLERHRMRGIHVLQFSLTGDDGAPFRPVPNGSVASLNTHDTPTFAGFCHGRDLDERVDAGLLSPDAAAELRRLRDSEIQALDRFLGIDSRDSWRRLERWHELLLASEAGLVMVNLEDLWLEERPQNVPGRTDLPNWRRKLAYALDELPPSAVEALEKLARRA